MLRQVSSRNQRSKGFKVKHALQIGLLVAVCIWLLYLVKHSHEKKRVFEERNSKDLNNVVENKADFFNFGRKELPHNKEMDLVNEPHKEDESEDTQEGHDTKQQEETEEEEGKGAAKDEIDEQDQEKGVEEAEHEEESTEEEDKDRQDEETDSQDEEKDGHGDEKDVHDEGKDGRDEGDLFDNQENEGVTQEAREENYKRDDASSAVVHDAHAIESETGSEDARNVDEEKLVDKVGYDSDSNGSKHDENSSVNGSDGKNDTSVDGFKSKAVDENSEKKVVESENMTNGTDDGYRGDNDLSAGSVSNVSDTVLKDNESIQTDNLSFNLIASDNRDIGIDDLGVELSKPDNGSISNSTTIDFSNSSTVEYDSQMVQHTNFTSAAESNSHIESQTNSTRYTSDNQTAMQNNSTMVNAFYIPTSNDTTASLDSAQTQSISANDAARGEDAHKSQDMMDISENNTTVGVDASKLQNVVDMSANNATGGENVVKSQNLVDISLNNATTGKDAIKSQNAVEASEESNRTTVLESEEHSTTSSTNDKVESDDSSTHSVITEEERDARTDLSTLPDIQNEIKTTDDEAAE